MYLFFVGCVWSCFFCLFFKQKTAYELRISDWSSDVCSSDLVVCGRIASHSLNRNGRLSIAEGRRKPYSASVIFRLWSPRDMPLIWPIVWWLSSTNSKAFSGKIGRASCRERACQYV